jgi:hypothetical protein
MREYRWHHSGRTGFIEHLGSFVPTTDARCENNPNEPGYYSEKTALRWFCVTQRSFRIQYCNSLSEVSIHLSTIEGWVNQPNEWDFGVGHGVTNGRLAAWRIPSDHAFLTEAHGRNMICALREAETRLRHLDNLSPALLIQYISSSVEKSRERATVCAVADESIVDACAFQLAADGAALALNWMHFRYHSLDNRGLLCDV